MPKQIEIGFHTIAGSDRGLGAPRKATDGSSGFDLVANLFRDGKPIENITIPVGGRAMVPTGIRVQIPFGFEGQVRPRSGLALKKGITVLNSPGTIDSDYRGEIGVILVNLSDANFAIEHGQRIAQLVIQTLPDVVLIEIEQLSETKRNEGGFGSTGLD